MEGAAWTSSACLDNLVRFIQPEKLDRPSKPYAQDRQAVLCSASYTALMTLPLRRQRVQTRRRFG